ncbi:DUF1549 and DUF1553 domain-containing protein [Verrucomicrobia bacterium]|nr:DUF1549 and DUF1553 domain-containing protein [Verrucomicrobiota bacterium]
MAVHLHGDPLILKGDTSIPHFNNEIVPILTKAGCNSGACHGSATGKGGFKLSLFAEDAQADYEAITRDHFARRVEMQNPGQSLILKKASKKIEHEGGRRIRSASDHYARLKQWITAGVPRGDLSTDFTKIQVSPAEIKAKAIGESRLIKVEALMPDGTSADVTRWCVFKPMDDGVADVTGQGEVIFQNHGVSSVMIRFGALTGSTRVGLPYPSSGAISDTFSRHPVDIMLRDEWIKWQLEPEKPAQPHVLIRRLFLDLTGQLPIPEDAKYWSAAIVSEQGFSKLVEHLTSTRAFADFWSLRFADWLLLDSKKLGTDAAKVYHDWLHQRILENQSVLGTARMLIEARGSFLENAPANFQRHATDPRDMAEYVGQAILGTRIACARCHNHPVDRWTLTDYHDFSAMFSKTSLDGGQAMFKNLGDIFHPKSGIASSPRPLGTPHHHGVNKEKDPLEVLGQWLETDGSTRFARAFANRTWKHLFGRGVVEPIDDIRPTNLPVIPGLLDLIAKNWEKEDYRFVALVRLIVSSSAYQQRARFDAFPGTRHGFFNAMQPRQYEGRVLIDAIRQVTGQHQFLEHVIGEENAIMSWDHRKESFALDILGRCDRKEPCQAPDAIGGGLSKSLYLFNDTHLQTILNEASKEWSSLFDGNLEAMVKELYWRAYARAPDIEEWQYWEQTISSQNALQPMWADMMWAVMNSREFLWTH